MTIAKALLREMDRSGDFTRENFGLWLGESYPEMVRELVADEHLAKRVAMLWMVEQMGCQSTIKKMVNLSPADSVRQVPEMTMGFFQFLYWGIQIGRDLQKQEDALLQQLSRNEGAK